MDNSNINIYDAVEANELQQVRAYFQSRPNELSDDTGVGNWLQVAARFGHLEMINFFIDAGIDVNERSGIFDAAPIKVAASKGHLEAVTLLIDRGTKLDTSKPVRNPLFGAIYGGHKDVAKLLLERGIDASVVYNGKNMKNMDAIAYAEEQGAPEIAAMIRKHLGK